MQIISKNMLKRKKRKNLNFFEKTLDFLVLNIYNRQCVTENDLNVTAQNKTSAISSAGRAPDS